MIWILSIKICRNIKNFLSRLNIYLSLFVSLFLKETSLFSSLVTLNLICTTWVQFLTRVWGPSCLSPQPVGIARLILFDVSKAILSLKDPFPWHPHTRAFMLPLRLLLGLLFPSLLLSFTCSPEFLSCPSDFRAPKASISILIVMTLKDIFSGHIIPFTDISSNYYT